MKEAMKTSGSSGQVFKWPSNVVLDTIAQIAFSHALEVVFKSENAMYSFIKDLRKKSKVAGFVLDIVMPFPRVATNILSQIVKYSPFGFIGVAKQLISVRKPGSDVKFDKNGT